MMRRRVGRPGLVGTMARTAVIAGTATAVSGGMQRSAAAKNAAAQQQQQTAMQSQAELADLQRQMASLKATQAPAGPASAGITSELERLAALKTAGVLSEEEFQAAKAKLLAT